MPSTGSSKRIRRKPEDAEREILDAAEEFLHDNDFRDLTIDEVMQRTGMRRSAFYNYFTDRYGLMLGLMGRIEKEMMEASRLWLDESDDPVQSLTIALDAAIQVWARHGHVLRAVHEASFHDAEVQRYYRDGLVQDFIDAIAERLRAENRAGRTAIPNPKEVAHSLAMLNAAVLAERLGRATGERPRTVSKTLQYVWLRTIYGQVPDAAGTARRPRAARQRPPARPVASIDC